MPRVPKSEVQPHQLHGVARVDSNLSFRDRMRKLWRPTDTVRIHNITSEKVEWQWLDENDEEYTIEDDTNIKITNREEPGLWFIDRGETDLLYGACAYMAVESMYKMACIMKTGVVLHPLDEREIRNFSIDDPEKQEEFLDLVFKSVVTPADMQRAAAAQIDDKGPKVLEHLIPLATEDEEYQRRQKSERGIVSRPGTRAGAMDDLAKEFIPEVEPMTPRATGGLPDDRKLPPEDPPKVADKVPTTPAEPAVASKPKPAAK